MYIHCKLYMLCMYLYDGGKCFTVYTHRFYRARTLYRNLLLSTIVEHDLYMYM